MLCQLTYENTILFQGLWQLCTRSLLFRLLIVLQLFSSCRSLLPFSQEPRLQKTPSSGPGSASHIGVFSSQCLAEQPGLVSWPARNNSQHLPNTKCICLSSVNIFLCLLLPVFHRRLYQSCKDPVSLTTSAAGPVVLVWFLPGILSLQMSPSLVLGKSLPSHTPSLSSPPPSAHRPFSWHSCLQLPLLILTARWQALSQEWPAPVCQHLTHHQQI